MAMTDPNAAPAAKGGRFIDIAVPLITHDNVSGTTSCALSLASMFGASTTGFAFVFDPVLPILGPFDAIPAEAIDEMVARGEQEAQENAAAFEQQAKQAGVKVTTKIVRAGINESAERFAAIARNFDISVVPQSSTEEVLQPDFAEAALFDSGRPVLVVPYIHRAALSLRRVLVCWDGSRAAARALADAWPLLERAEAVNIVTAGKADDVPAIQESVREHFAQHGVSAQLQTLGVEDIDAGNAILSYAADVGASLIVMGGYGHSRVREWVLGGVTRTILQTMTVPVLLSH